MANLEWNKEYENLLRESQERGEIDTRQDERRRQPRFKLSSEYVWIKVEPRFPVLNVSVSGIAFFSDLPFKPGEFLNITLGKAFSVEAEVVDCQLVESDPNFMETRYHVRGKFANEMVGMQFLVMIKEMDNLGESAAE